MSNNPTDIPVITTIADPDAEVQTEVVGKPSLREKVTTFATRYKKPLIAGAALVTGALVVNHLSKNDSPSDPAQPLELEYAPEYDGAYVTLESHDPEIA